MLWRSASAGVEPSETGDWSMTESCIDQPFARFVVGTGMMDVAHAALTPSASLASLRARHVDLDRLRIALLGSGIARGPPHAWGLAAACRTASTFGRVPQYTACVGSMASGAGAGTA